MKRSLIIPAYWGILHGINDWVAGYMLARFSLMGGHKESFFALIVYAVLAFAGQLPLGLWVDKSQNLKTPAATSVWLLIFSIIIFSIDPFAAIIIAGLASAGVHIVGGCICFGAAENKITPLSIFTAPGVAGLALGGFCINMNENYLWFMLVPVMLCGIIIWLKGIPLYRVSKPSGKSEIDSHDVLMLIILLAMVMRSFLFDLLNTYSQHFEYGLLITGLSAFAGKLISGLLGDRIGWKKWVFITLPLAFIFLELGRDNVYAFAFGVACLQSSVPVTLLLIYRSMPQYPATASAFGLGVCVALAGLPLYGLPQLHKAFNQPKNAFIIIAAVILLITAAIIFYQKKSAEKNISKI